MMFDDDPLIPPPLPAKQEVVGYIDEVNHCKFIADKLKTVSDQSEQTISQIRQVLISAWLDPAFDDMRSSKQYTTNAFSPLEVALVNQIYLIFKQKEIPAVIASLIMLVLGRDKVPETHPEWFPDNIEIFKMRTTKTHEALILPKGVELIIHTGPHVFTPKILFDAIIPLNQTRNTWKITNFTHPASSGAMWVEDPTEYIADPKTLCDRLQLSIFPKQSRLILNNLATKEYKIKRYSYMYKKTGIKTEECVWVQIESDHFKFAWGNDASLGRNGDNPKIPWINLLNDQVPPTLHYFKSSTQQWIYPSVEWIAYPNIEDSEGFIDPQQRVCQYKDKDAQFKWIGRQIEQLNDPTKVDPDICPKIDVYDPKDGFKNAYDPTAGSKSENYSKKSQPKTVYVWPDKDTKEIPFESLETKYATDFANVWIVECTDAICHDSKCPFKISKRVSPKLALNNFPDKGWGVIAQEDIEFGRFIAIYTGEIRTSFNSTPTDRYAFALTNGDIDLGYISAEKKGNITRFVNHACSNVTFKQPNCRAIFMTSHFYDYRIGFFANRQILAGEELSLDYASLIKEGEHQCQCNLCSIKRWAAKSEYNV